MDDFAKREAAKVANNSSQLEIKMRIGRLEGNTETGRRNEYDVNLAR
ncbi:MAG: hypothetical protein Q7J07_07920 [Pelolinea sp.]|nr:hypothetical protein [Pelolinea sp.]